MFFGLVIIFWRNFLLFRFFFISLLLRSLRNDFFFCKFKCKILKNTTQFYIINYWHYCCYWLAHIIWLDILIYLQNRRKYFFIYYIYYKNISEKYLLTCCSPFLIRQKLNVSLHRLQGHWGKGVSEKYTSSTFFF